MFNKNPCVKTQKRDGNHGITGFSEIGRWPWGLQNYPVNVSGYDVRFLGTDLQAQIESQTAEHREQELFHNFKHQMMRKLKDIIFRGALDKDDREMATKNSQKVKTIVKFSSSMMLDFYQTFRNR